MTTTATRTVKFDAASLEGDAPLYALYGGQSQEQPAYIALDLRDGECEADYSGEIGGGIPATVWHNVVRRYSVTPRLSRESIVRLVERITPDLQAVLDDSSTEWDGSNTVGVLGPDAAAAEERIERTLYDAVGDIDVWDAYDWITAGGANNLADIWPAGESLDDAAKRLTAEAKGDDDIYFVEGEAGCRQALIDWAERVANNADDDDADPLTPEQRAAITA